MQNPQHSAMDETIAQQQSGELVPVALLRHVNDPDDASWLDDIDMRTLLNEDPLGSLLEQNRDHISRVNLHLDAAEQILMEPLREPVAEESAAPEPYWIHLEEARPLSQSMLWKMMEDFYSSMGIDAWTNSTPYFVTNSIFIADSYADLVVSFLKDYLPHLNKKEPIYLIEMAAGCGRFSFHFITELSRKVASFKDLRDLKLCFVMTDFTDNNVSFWRDHEAFAPFVEAGKLDFAVYRPEDEETLTLQVSGVTLTPERVKNPIIAIANYFFDTIKHDLFRVKNRRLEEGRIGLNRDISVVPVENPVRIEQVQTYMEYAPLRNENYYKDPEFNAILRHYKHNIPEGSVIFPLGGLKCMQNLRRLSSNNLMLLSSDKSFTFMEDMMVENSHGFAVHGGSFSFNVNYDAIGRLFENAGGRYFRTTYKNQSLQTVCCIRVNHTNTFENVAYAYQERLDRMNPINSLNDIQLIMDGPGDYPLCSLLAFLRISMHEPRALYYCASKIMSKLEEITWNQRDDLLRLLDEIWDRHYFFRGEINLPFWIGHIYVGLGMYDRGLEFFLEAEKQFGKHESIHFFAAYCLNRMGEFEQAREHCQLAMDMAPQFSEAQELMAEINANVQQAVQ